MVKGKPYILIELTPGTFPSKKSRMYCQNAAHVYGYTINKDCNVKFTFLIKINADIINKTFNEIKSTIHNKYFNLLPILEHSWINQHSITYQKQLIQILENKHPNHNLIIFEKSFHKVLKLRATYKHKLNIKIFYSEENSKKKKFLHILFFFALKHNYLTFIFNLSLILYTATKYIIFKPKFKQPIHTDILLMSNSIKYFVNNMDFYQKTMHETFKKNDIPHSVILLNDYNHQLSLFNYISIFNIITSVYHAIKNLIIITNNTTLFDLQTQLPYQLFQMECFRIFLKKEKPRAVIYYDEFYLNARYLSYILDTLNIDSWGLQHCVISNYFPVSHNARLQTLISQYFPKNLLIYGDITEKLLLSFGYKQAQLYKIGFDRIVTPKESPRRVRHSSKLLYLSPLTKEGFIHFYNKIKSQLPCTDIAIRPHPGYGKVFIYDKTTTKEQFQNEFPNVKYINSKKESYLSNLQEYDIVFCVGPSTALLDAILFRKVVISFQEKEFVDFYNIKAFGAQTVSTFSEINWELKANPEIVKKECTPQVNIVDLFKC